MTRSPRPASVTPPCPNRLRITALGVGHGDAVLVRWENDEKVWTCLVDGGQSPETLQKRLDDLGVKHLDLLVLTHLDSDHAGGLAGLTREIHVSSYWGPALPAFERLQALFGARCGAAIQRGRDLEDELRKAGTFILYPLEGHKSAPLEGQGVVSVLSPAPRLIRRFLTGEDVQEMFTQRSSSWGWLLEPQPGSGEQTEHLVRLDAALAKGVIEPDPDLDGIPSSPVEVPRGWAQTMQECCAARGVEPEFFGDWVMNNTSLVLYLELRTENRTHTVLLPGDQEDWTYLLARNPRGLKADVFMASHHGGRVFLGTDPAHNEVFSSIRPTVVLISGNGAHGLPHEELRQTALGWGASVACTCSRKKEFFSGALPTGTCCQAIHTCETGMDITLFLDREGIHSDRPACAGGQRNQPGPAILIRQHVVDPSPILQNLAQQELLAHIGWIQRKLKEVHQNRVQQRQGELGSSDPVPLGILEDLARGAGRSCLVTYLPEVLRHGMRNDSFWAAVSSHNSSITQAYARPGHDEVKAFLNLLANKEVLLFTNTRNPEGLDRDTLIHSLDVEGLARLAEAHILLPVQAFRETLWPEVAKFLKTSRWHCYYRENQGVAFSIRGGVQGFVLGVLEALRGDSEWNGNWDALFRGIDLPFLAPVFLDDLGYYNSQPYTYCTPLERWFSPDIPSPDLSAGAFRVTQNIRMLW